MKKIAAQIVFFVALLLVCFMAWAVVGTVVAVDPQGDIITYQYSRQTVNAAPFAMSLEIAPGEAFALAGYKIHLAGTPTTTESMIVTKNANAGAVYDSVVYDQDLDNLADKLNYWAPPIPFAAGDTATFSYVNTDTNTFALEVAYYLDTRPPGWLW